jgi:Fe-S oxidoreductase
LVDGASVFFMDLTRSPRAVLRAFPGVTVVEMRRNQRWSWCCGGDGGVPEPDPDLAQWTAADRLREAKETGAELILTSSSLCQRLFAALQQAALPTQDLIEFVGQAV